MLPPGVFNVKDIYSRKRWRQVQYLADLFWTRWRKQYLPLLQIRQKWNEKKRNLTVGDVVLVLDQNLPRNMWLLGRVIETLPDKSGFVRSVRVLTKTNTLKRPINKLVLLCEASGC